MNRHLSEAQLVAVHPVMTVHPLLPVPEKMPFPPLEIAEPAQQPHRRPPEEAEPAQAEVAQEGRR